MKNNIDPRGKKKDRQSWRYTFEGNLPYEPKDMLVFNMPPNDEETPNSTPSESALRIHTKSVTSELRLKSQGSSLARNVGSKMKEWM